MFKNRNDANKFSLFFTDRLDRRVGTALNPLYISSQYCRQGLWCGQKSPKLKTIGGVGGLPCALHSSLLYGLGEEGVCPVHWSLSGQYHPQHFGGKAVKNFHD